MQQSSSAPKTRHHQPDPVFPPSSREQRSAASHWHKFASTITPPRSFPPWVGFRGAKALYPLLFATLLALLGMPLRSEATVSEPQILSQPESQTVSSGSNVTFSVTAFGDNPSYQWWFNGHVLSDGTNASYTLMNVEAGDTGDYQVVVYNEAYWMASTVAHLTFVEMDQAPVITVQPESQSVGENNSATFSVTATGDNLVYQWAFNGHSIPDGTNATYTLTNAGSGNAGSYEVFVSNPAGFVASTLASLTAVGASLVAVITVQPVSQTVRENSGATCSVEAEGENLAYQWWFNGYPLPDGTNAACTLMNAGEDNAGEYQVVVSNEAGWMAVGVRVTLTVV